ncbi:MAG: hypothetical protein ACJ8BW_11400 [Ktedonobacteraceae bacterium]
MSAYDAADFTHEKGGRHPGYCTSNGHHPDPAFALACHTNLDGRSGSVCACVHAYWHAENDPGASVLRPCPLREVTI